MNNLLNLKSFLKFLSKHKSYTFIDVFGLSVSLMFVILIAIYTKQELTVDNWHEKKERIYVLGNDNGVGTAYRISDRILERYPEIEKTCAMTYRSQESVLVGELKVAAELLLADTTFFGMFDFDLAQGNKETALDARNYAVISETFARKVFPGTDPLGKMIRMNDSVNVMVNGIMHDIKNSTIPYCDILIRMDNIKYFNAGMDSQEFNNAGSTIIFILKHVHADLHAKTGDMADYFREIFWLYKRNINTIVQFVPLQEVYFSSLNDSGYLLRKGDSQFVVILLSIGILILVFAIINYINLTMAQIGFRAKEMATRRLLGSSRGELFMRLILESTMLTCISFIIGLFLAWLCLPFANNLLETKLYFGDTITFRSGMIALLLIVGIGGFAGLLPAFIISNSKPVDVVKGTFRQKTKMVFSKIFITFQNVITITLLAASLTMILQINHLIKAPLGYNTTNIIDISAWGFEGDEQVRLIAGELEQLASVKRVAFSQGTPFDRGNNNTMVFEGKNISFQIFVGDTTYFDMLGFQILMDNNLGNMDGYYLSEQSFRELGIADDVPSVTFENGWHIPVAGKVKDFQLRNISTDNSPVLLQLQKVEDFWRIWNMLVEVEGNPATAYAQVKEITERITGLDFDGRFIDQQITESFASQKRTSRIVMVFTFVAILISLLGLLAMSTYFIQQRSKEVAVRKVFGSDNRQILLKLVSTFFELCPGCFRPGRAGHLLFYDQVAERVFVPDHSKPLDLYGSRTVLPADFVYYCFLAKPESSQFQSGR